MSGVSEPIEAERFGSFRLYSRSQSVEQQSMDCSLAQG